MSKNPINLLLRFVLEVIALVIAGFWGFQTFQGIMGYVAGIGAPLFMAIIWGVFAVSEDPSRSGKTVIDTPGPIRFLIEIAYFSFAAYAFHISGHVLYGYIFAACVVIHYILSYDRIQWLFTKK